MKGWEWLLFLFLILLLLGQEQTSLAAPGTANEESWSWVDRWGHRYQITVHRQVH